LTCAQTSLREFNVAAPRAQFVVADRIHDATYVGDTVLIATVIERVTVKGRAFVLSSHCADLVLGDGERHTVTLMATDRLILKGIDVGAGAHLDLKFHVNASDHFGDQMSVGDDGKSERKSEPVATSIAATETASRGVSLSDMVRQTVLLAQASSHPTAKITAGALPVAAC
jgi:hypothetical protein